jgi:hypothetical protein
MSWTAETAILPVLQTAETAILQMLYHETLMAEVCSWKLLLNSLLSKHSEN